MMRLSVTSEYAVDDLRSCSPGTACAWPGCWLSERSC